MALRRAPVSTLAGRLFGGSPAQRNALMQAAWPLAVGPEVARRTEVVGADGATLRIRVPDAGWRRVLHRMRGDILARLREIAGELAPRRLGFVEGAVADTPAPERAVPVLDVPAADALRAPAAAIADPEIRARFLEAAARYLARARAEKGRHE